MLTSATSWRCSKATRPSSTPTSPGASVWKITPNPTRPPSLQRQSSASVVRSIPNKLPSWRTSGTWSPGQCSAATRMMPRWRSCGTFKSSLLRGLPVPAALSVCWGLLAAASQPAWKWSCSGLSKQVPRLALLALASSYRVKFPDLDVDTLHGMFRLRKPEHETWDLMIDFDLIVIDEVGQLSRDIFERVLRLWDHAERRPALVFVGDFHQLRGMDPTRAMDSHRWKQVVVRHLRTMRRCQCEELRWKLQLLRTAKPTRQQLLQLVRGHRAMPDRGPGVSQEPTTMDVQGMLAETPSTTFVSITRRNAALLNDLAIEALFGEEEPVCFVPGDPESNTDNYDEAGNQIDCQPQQVPIYIGARVTLTRNVNKEQHFVNGMTAEVIDVRQRCVVVRTRVGNIVTVFPYTDDAIEVDNEFHRVTYLPLRLGYAVTLQKVQGATLDHITIWLDKPNVEAAGYVALSRVRRDADWRFMGHVTPHHFTPASGV